MLAETRDLYVRLEEVQQRLQRQCMERKGFHVHPPIRVQSVDRLPHLEGNPFQPLPSAPPDPSPAVKPSARESEFDQLTDAEQSGYLAALASYEEVTGDDGTVYRVPKSGCAREVLDLLFDDYMSYLSLYAIANGGRETPTEAVEQSDQAKAAYANWSTCMERAGYPHAATPEDVYQLFDPQTRPKHLPPLPTNQEERDRLAVKIESDIKQCANETGLWESLSRVWETKLVEYLAVHEAEIFAYRDVLLEALRRGQAALSAG